MMTTVSATPPLSPVAGYMQWLEKADRNNRLSLIPHVAVGMRALSCLAAHFALPGPWRAVTTLLYTANALLVPSAVRTFMRCISNLRSRPQDFIISKLRDARTLFESSLPLLASAVFAAIGAKEACQLLGYSVKRFDGGLAAAIPWISLLGRITALFQIDDVIHGIQLSSDINRLLVLKRTGLVDELVFCVDVLKSIEKHRSYLDGWNQLPSASKWEAAVNIQINCGHKSRQTEEKLYRLAMRVTKATDSLFDWSNYRMRSQAAGLLANVLRFAAIMITNPVGVSTLLLGASIAGILREVCGNYEILKNRTT